MDGIKISMLMRCNMWGKTTQVFDIIKENKKLICPWGHTKEQNELFEKGKFNNEKFSKIFINNLEINDYVLLFDREYSYAIVLKIKSKPYTTKFDNICCIRKITCEHKPVVCSDKCGNCELSKIEVVSKSYIKNNFDNYSKYLCEEYEFESLYGIVRDIEYIGELQKGDDIYEKYKILRNSIAQPKEEIIIGRKIIKNITIENIKTVKEHNYANSKIKKCIINNLENDEKFDKYKNILTYVYNIIDNGVEIIKNTILNIKTVKKEDDGFYYLEDIGISIQDVDNNSYLYEILNYCSNYNININLSIELENKTIINIVL